MDKAFEGFSFVDESQMGYNSGASGAAAETGAGAATTVFGSRMVSGVATGMGGDIGIAFNSNSGGVKVTPMHVSSSLPRSGAGATMLATSLKKQGQTQGQGGFSQMQGQGNYPSAGATHY